MNATHFDVSPTGPSDISSDAASVDPMSGRCFAPYVQDPPVVLDERVRDN